MARYSVISDMDGVIYRGKELVPGAREFVERLGTTDTKFLFLTNNSEQTPIDLVRKLKGLGIDGLTEDNFITSMIKSDGSFLAFFERPIAGVLGAVTLLIWFVPMGLQLYRRKKAAPA